MGEKGREGVRESSVGLKARTSSGCTDITLRHHDSVFVLDPSHCSY